ncbi:MAG: helix-turn-helix domain-containing protein [Steroidobacteraceae bacterium]
MSEGIGARLRSARERSRLTILQAAERLHVDAEVLEALEAENFAALGAPVYVKGHLRHYAELVGEPVEALFDLYSQGTRVPQPDLTHIPHPLEDETRRLVAPAVIVVIGFAVAGAVWWGLSLSHRQWSVTAARPVPAAAPLPQPVPVASASPAQVLPASAVVVPHGQIDVVLTYSADCWTEVYDATGRRLLYGLSMGPATRKLEGVPPLDVLLGYASGVTLEVGGRAASISRFVRPDHTARFLIAGDGGVLAAPPKKGG